MKEDVASNHRSRTLPILDMAMWTTRNKILHQHYTKPMASKAVIMARSAFTDREKKNMLVEEGNRRLRNCHPDLPWPKKAAFLTDMNLSMKQAGHTEKFRAMVTTRALARYSKAMKNHRSKAKIMYRSNCRKQHAYKKYSTSANIILSRHSSEKSVKVKILLMYP